MAAVSECMTADLTVTGLLLERHVNMLSTDCKRSDV